MNILSKQHRSIRSRLAVVLALTLLRVVPALPGTPSPQDASGNNPAPADVDPGWPRLFNLSGGSALIYQPQIASWDDQKHIVAWSALSYTQKGSPKPTLGSLKMEAETKVAPEARLVELSPVRFTEFNFPSLSREDARKIVDELQESPLTKQQAISLDRVLAGVDKSQINLASGNATNLRAAPPKIFESTKQAVLIIFDGQPVWSPIKDLDLKYAVNTNWDVFQTADSKTIYLRNDSTWLKGETVFGPWQPAGSLPDSFSRLPNDENWKEVRASLPGARVAPSALPRMFVSFQPAELILLKGTPLYVPVASTSLLWVSNTESDLFRMNANGAFYYLVAGRWFSAPTLDGPWEFATTKLPDDFRRIPVEHPRSRVLASVPGTDQATEAVLLASVPQTARVNRNELKAPDVIFQGGPPEFKIIETTTVRRAENTDKDIFQVGDLYYMCFQGVWFSARSATGPWEVAAIVPKEIYQIPASSPAYHVTYVTVEKNENDSDNWVTFAAWAGYTGMMVAWGCAVWGTGWYYPPYIWHGGFYPGYFWHPTTYGFAAWYNPHTGTYGRGTAVYGPYGGAGGWAAYNPRTGTYARGGAVFGPYGSRSFQQAYNPRSGAYGQTRQGSNIYGNWGSSYVQRGDDWAHTGHVTNYVTGRTTTGARTSEGGAAIHSNGPAGSSTIARTGSGDIYAGHDGNVYRKQNGSWQKWNDGGWSPVENPKENKNGGRPDSSASKGDRAGGDSGTRNQSPNGNQLDHDRNARQEGDRRSKDSRDYSLNRGGRNSAGSYRFGGGGRAGFGRRRR
jgi:hypothetical protein